MKNPLGCDAGGSERSLIHFRGKVLALISDSKYIYIILPSQQQAAIALFATRCLRRKSKLQLCLAVAYSSATFVTLPVVCCRYFNNVTFFFFQ